MTNPELNPNPQGDIHGRPSAEQLRELQEPLPERPQLPPELLASEDDIEAGRLRPLGVMTRPFEKYQNKTTVEWWLEEHPDAVFAPAPDGNFTVYVPVSSEHKPELEE